MKSLLAVILLFTAVPAVNANSAWSYSGPDGPENWVDTYTACGGESQSPIDIDTDDADDDNLGTFNLNGFDDVADKSMTLVNNGHSMQVNLVKGDFSVSGGGLDGTYITAQFHFHWGSTDGQGSEHLLDGEASSAEMHMVHYKNKFASLTAALAEPEGVAVLGFFIEVAAEDNAGFSTLLAAAGNVEQPGDEYDFPSAFSLRDLLPVDISEFYRYSGSLTTPACTEGLVWTMFKQPIYLSSDQLAVFRTLQNETGDALEDNFRPTQALNGREVIFSSPDNEPSHGNTIVSSLLLPMLSFVILAFMK